MLNEDGGIEADLTVVCMIKIILELLVQQQTENMINFTY